jgi:hypothetical protein
MDVESIMEKKVEVQIIHKEHTSEKRRLLTKIKCKQNTSMVCVIYWCKIGFQVQWNYLDCNSIMD